MTRLDLRRQDHKESRNVKDRTVWSHIVDSARHQKKIVDWVSAWFVNVIYVTSLEFKLSTGEKPLSKMLQQTLALKNLQTFPQCTISSKFSAAVFP